SARFELVETASARFDLSLILGEQRASDGSPGGIGGILEYATDLFDRGSAEAIGARLVRLLAAGVAQPDRAISRLEILAPAERAAVLRGWNATGRAIAHASLPELF